MSRHLHVRSAHCVALRVPVIPMIGMAPWRSRGSACACGDAPRCGMSGS